MNNSQVAHCWANQTKAKGRGSNFFFEGESIYSYGGHFEVARLVQTEKGKPISLHTTTLYSVTTESHKSAALAACHNLHDQFFVPSFPMRRMEAPTRAWFKEVFAHYRDKAVESYRKAKRARKYTDMHLLDAEEAIANARALKAHFPKATKGLRIRSVDDGEIARIEAKAKAQAKRNKKERARRDKDERELMAEQEKEWLNYERDRIGIGWRSPNRNTRYLLRKHATKDRIETSHGAEVHMWEGEAFYKVLDRYRNRPSDCPRANVNGFRLTRLEESGAVIGCHTLSWEVMDAFAKKHFNL